MLMATGQCVCWSECERPTQSKFVKILQNMPKQIHEYESEDWKFQQQFDWTVRIRQDYLNTGECGVLRTVRLPRKQLKKCLKRSFKGNRQNA